MATTQRRNEPVSLKALLEAGVHFGHQKNRWNPKMKSYIFAERNGIHILDLQQSVPMLEAAHEYVSDLTANGRHILFVGTKKQAQEIVRREAEPAARFTSHRWLGGSLTNFVTFAGVFSPSSASSRSTRGATGTCAKNEAAQNRRSLQRARAQARRHARHGPCSPARYS